VRNIFSNNTRTTNAHTSADNNNQHWSIDAQYRYYRGLYINNDIYSLADKAILRAQLIERLYVFIDSLDPAHSGYFIDSPAANGMLQRLLEE